MKNLPSMLPCAPLSVHTKSFFRKVIIASFLSLTGFQSFSQLSFGTQAVPSGLEFTIAATGAVQTGNFNGDSFVDVIFNTAAGAGITYWQNNGAGAFTTPATNPFAAFTASTPAGFVLNTSSSIADFDGDGDLDIWQRVPTATDNYLRNDNGTYSTQAVPSGLEFTIAATGAVQTGDFNGDSFVDVIFNTAAGAGITYWQNNGAGAFTTPATNPFAAFTASTPAGFVLNTSSSIADFDGDGDLDIWQRVPTATDNYLRNDNGTYSTQAVPSGLEFTIAATGAVQTGDFNGDSFVDVIFNTAAGAGITYWQNNGAGAFTTPATNPFAAFTASTPAGFVLNTSSSIADFDGDGDLDIWQRVPTATDNYLKGSGEAPRLLSSTPANNVTSVVRDAVIYLRFNENVKVGNGAIYIHRASNGAMVQIIGANSTAVTGSGTSTLAITPLAALNAFTGYYITFSRGAIMDVDESLLFGYLNETTKQRMPYSTSSFLSFTTSGILPVSLLNFTVAEKQGKALLSWQTASEQNSALFIIQQSMNGSVWQNIGSVAAAGTSTSLRSYTFTAAQAMKGKNYYRLSQVDRDGRQVASEIKVLQMGEAAGFRLYPNPAKSETTIQLFETGLATVTIFNAGGQVVWQDAKNTATIVLPMAHLPAGLYQVTVLQNGHQYKQQLIRN